MVRTRAGKPSPRKPKSPVSAQKKSAYWKANLRLLAILLACWFVVSFGLSILLVDVLDRVRVGGFKLGFWFAQQGSILAFLVLIFIYVRRMNVLDRAFRVEEKES